MWRSICSGLSRLLSCNALLTLWAMTSGNRNPNRIIVGTTKIKEKCRWLPCQQTIFGLLMILKLAKGSESISMQISRGTKLLKTNIILSVKKIKSVALKIEEIFFFISFIIVVFFDFEIAFIIFIKTNTEKNDIYDHLQRW